MGVGLYVLSPEPAEPARFQTAERPQPSPQENRSDEAPRAVTREQLLADLKLVATPCVGNELPVGSIPCFRLELVNTSVVRSYWVIQPGDGSNVGRNPHITYRATQERPGGGTVEVPYVVSRFCGNYDPDWGSDVVELPPQARLSLKEAPWPTIDFQRPGRATVRAYYTYREGQAGIFYGSAPLRGAPSFVLESNPVVFNVVRPLDLTVKVKGLGGSRLPRGCRT
jgi:hypothetical protein